MPSALNQGLADPGADEVDRHDGDDGNDDLSRRPGKLDAADALIARLADAAGADDRRLPGPPLEGDVGRPGLGLIPAAGGGSGRRPAITADPAEDNADLAADARAAQRDDGEVQRRRRPTASAGTMGPMVDSKPMRRGDTPAYKRIWEEEVTGGTIERPDATIVRRGKVVKPRKTGGSKRVVYDFSGNPAAEADDAPA